MADRLLPMLEWHLWWLPSFLRLSDWKLANCDTHSTVPELTLLPLPVSFFPFGFGLLDCEGVGGAALACDGDEGCVLF